MIKFPAIEVDEEYLYKIAKDSFFEYAKNYSDENKKEFDECMQGYGLDELKISLMQIQYTKYNHEQDLLPYDQSTEFHFGVKIHIYIIDSDSDGDEEVLVGYLLILNSKFEHVDSFWI